MKILISGATGFIGKNLLELLYLNKIDFCCIIRSTTDTSFLDSNNFKCFIDNGQIENLIAHIKSENYTGIIHLASLFIAEHNKEQINELINSNILFGTKLVEAAVLCKVKWFINTGTYWQHFDGEQYNPANLYAATKQAFEDILKFYAVTSNLVCTTLKLNDTYGDGDNRKKVFNLWEQISKTGETLDMSPGEQLIDIVHVSKVTEAFLKLIKLLQKEDAKKHQLKSYYVSSNNNISLKELAFRFEKENNTKLNINWGGRSYRKREVMKPICIGENIDNIS